MKKSIIKLINLFALLGSVAWFSRSPDWEPAITSLVLLSTLIGQDLAQNTNPTVDKHDQELFKKFIQDFPSNGHSASFLKDHDMANSFPKEDLNELNNFTSQWNNAEYEFHNKILESKRKNLYLLSKRFLDDLSVHIFSNGAGFFSMELKDFEDRPDILEKRVNLNKDATEIYEAHQEFIRLGSKYV